MPTPVRLPLRPENVEGHVVDPGYPLGASNDNAAAGIPHWPSSPGLAWFALLIGLMPVVTALVRGSAWDTEPTIGLVLSCLGIAGLGHYYTCAVREWAQRRSSRRRCTPEV